MSYNSPKGEDPEPSLLQESSTLWCFNPTLLTLSIPISTTATSCTPSSLDFHLVGVKRKQLSPLSSLCQLFSEFYIWHLVGIVIFVLQSLFSMSLIIIPLWGCRALVGPCFEFYRVTIKREKYKRNKNVTLTQAKIDVKSYQSEWHRHPIHIPERLLPCKN